MQVNLLKDTKQVTHFQKEFHHSNYSNPKTEFYLLYFFFPTQSQAHSSQLSIKKVMVGGCFQFFFFSKIIHSLYFKYRDSLASLGSSVDKNFRD